MDQKEISLPIKIRLHCLRPVGDPGALPAISQDAEGYFIAASSPEKAAELERVGETAAASGRRFREAFAEGAD